jgi:hypothetical protein
MCTLGARFARTSKGMKKSVLNFGLVLSLMKAFLKIQNPQGCPSNHYVPATVKTSNNSPKKETGQSNKDLLGIYLVYNLNPPSCMETLYME